MLLSIEIKRFGLIFSIKTRLFKDESSTNAVRQFIKRNF